MVISGERVKQARELKAMTQATLAKAVGVSQAAIAQIESGIFLASDDLLHQIAGKTGQPIRFFSQDPASEFPVGSLLFRSHGTMTKRELSVTYRNAQLAYEVYVRLRAKLRSLPVKIPKMVGSDPLRAARETRKILGIPFDTPIPHLLNVLEWSGVIAVVVPHIKSSEAFSLWFEDSPVLSLSSDRSGDRARLSVAHELGHLTLHAGKSRFEVDDYEADDFAAEFLMPEVVIAKELRTPVTLSSLAALKSRWRVSIQALIRRAKDVGIISDRQYKYLFEQLSAMGWRRHEPVEIVPEHPRALRQMAEMVYGDPIDFRAMGHDVALEADQLRLMLSYFATKSEGPSVRSNVVSLSRSRNR
jgi:Zn-dependent peptidase ImmA (M78 family)/transcriptional regulator with XRE-family HTH domain